MYRWMNEWMYIEISTWMDDKRDDSKLQEITV